MNIELLYVANCPNHVVALERLRATLSEENLQTPVNEVLVSDAATAQSLKFPGSPTIRINGHDVEPHTGQTTSFGLMCRLYSDGSGVPSQQSLRAAKRVFRGSDGQLEDNWRFSRGDTQFAADFELLCASTVLGRGRHCRGFRLFS
jgi:hypothetical protein